MERQFRIYSSFVQSVVLYGSETRTMRKVDNIRIQSFRMQQALRCILDIRWYDNVSNAAVQDRTKLRVLPSLIADRRHSLFGHVCRLPKNTPASQVLQVATVIIDAHTGAPPAANWKRPPGRPTKDNVAATRLSRRTLRVSVGLAQITSQDHSLWRSLRLSAIVTVKRSSDE